MATASIVKTASAQGKTFSYALSQTTDGALVKDPTLAAAKGGTLTTRTSDTAGTLTMSSGHGITDGQVIDIYWSTGQVTSATVGTVATNSVPFTGATGPEARSVGQRDQLHRLGSRRRDAAGGVRRVVASCG
jgi:hypothetical protein